MLLSLEESRVPINLYSSKTIVFYSLKGKKATWKFESNDETIRYQLNSIYLPKRHNLFIYRFVKIDNVKKKIRLMTIRLALIDDMDFRIFEKALFLCINYFRKDIIL